MQKPITSATISYVAGILYGRGFLFFPLSAIVLFLLTALPAAVLLAVRARTRRLALLLTLAFLAGASAFIWSAAWFPANHLSSASPADKKNHEITGRIASSLERNRDRTSAILDVSTVDGERTTGKARLSVRGNAPLFGYGDSVRVTGRIFEPRGYRNPGGFDYAGYLARKGMYRIISVRQESGIQVLTRGTGLFRAIQDQRERIRNSFLAALTGPGSAVLQAMVLGEEGELTDELRDRFMAAGVTHIISISGSHLGMVALLCFGMIRLVLFLLPEPAFHRLTLVTDPKKIAALLTLPLVLYYTLLAGGEVATVRSLIMISAGLAAMLLDRDHAVMHSLALAALAILVVDPQALFDISFQLSYLSVLVIGAVVTLHQELGIHPTGVFRKLRNGLAAFVAVSLAANLATAPLAAHYFNQVSLAGVLSNLLVVPFAGIIVVPLGLFSAILSLFMNSLPLAALNQAAADAFVALVGFFSRIPIAEFHVGAPGVLWILCYMIALAAAFSLARNRLLVRFHPLEESRRMPGLAKVLFPSSVACLVVLTLWPSFRNMTTRISFPDVGQGDCALIEFSSGKTMLIDGGGTHDNRFDIGRRIVAPFLWNRGIQKIDLVVLSHPHPDHLNGLLSVLSKFDVKEVWTHGFDRDLPGYAELERIIARQGIPRTIVAASTPARRIGDAECRVLQPSEEFRIDEKTAYRAENDRSLVLRISDGNGVYLFPGDIGFDAERVLAARDRPLRCDILKVPHHGSRSSSSEPFLAATQPAVAVVTAGKDNPYGHPNEDVLGRYHAIGASVYRTDLDGAVQIIADQGRFETRRAIDITLRRIAVDDVGSWLAVERGNWGRLQFRQ